MTFTESAHPRALDGKFTDRTNSEPVSQLQRPLPADTASMDALIRRQREAEALLFAAKAAAHAANRDLAGAYLRRAFPWAEGATFAASWDEGIAGGVRLSNVYGPDQHIDFDDDVDWREWCMSADASQTDDIEKAKVAVTSLGEEVFTYLEFADGNGESLHTLDLTETHPPVNLVGQLDRDARGNLYASLSDMDGRLPSMVSTSEFEYQLTEGAIATEEPEMAAALITEYGSAEKAAEAIAESEAWFQQREAIGDRIHNELDDAIHAAAVAALKGR